MFWTGRHRWGKFVGFPTMNDVLGEKRKQPTVLSDKTAESVCAQVISVNGERRDEENPEKEKQGERCDA